MEDYAQNVKVTGNKTNVPQIKKKNITQHNSGIFPKVYKKFPFQHWRKNHFGPT